MNCNTTHYRANSSSVPGDPTLGNSLRQFAQFVIAPLSPGFNLDRYDRELRRPFPSEPLFAPESKIWRREHAMAHAERSAMIAELRTLRA